jgi:hypothetical protein
VLFAGHGDDVFEFDQRHGVIVMLFTSGMQAAFVEVVSELAVLPLTTRPGIARRLLTLLLLRQKKVSKEKATRSLGSYWGQSPNSPSLWLARRCGATHRSEIGV